MSVPAWFTPARMLAIFTCMSLVVYLDRGLIASTGVNGRQATEGEQGTGIQGAFNLSNFQDGCLPAAFMVGLMVCSPLFAELSKTRNAFKLVGVGLGTWVLGVALCSVCFDFWSLLLCRTLVGAGEASFVILTAPFIDDYAPPHLRSLWLSIFYMAIPVGYACGYIYGGVVGSALGWRAAFLSEACLMLPFVVFAFCTEPLPLSAQRPATPVSGGSNSSSSSSSDDSGGGGGDFDDAEADALGSATEPLALSAREPRHASLVPPPSEVWRDLTTILRVKLFVLAVVGSTAHTAVLGMYSYWGPKAVSYMFSMQGTDADLTFGVVTVLTGIFGTLTGGVILDRIGATKMRSSALCLFALSAGFMLVQAAFLLCRGLPAFVAVFAAGEFVLFMVPAPTTTIILKTVPTELRPLAFSVQTITIHVLGDVPSPPLAGWLHDHLFHRNDVAHPQSWRATVLLFNMVFLVGVVAFTAATAIAWSTPHMDSDSLSLLGQQHPRRRRRGMFVRVRRDVPALDTVVEGETPTSSVYASSAYSSRLDGKDDAHS